MSDISIKCILIRLEVNFSLNINKYAMITILCILTIFFNESDKSDNHLVMFLLSFYFIYRILFYFIYLFIYFVCVCVFFFFFFLLLKIKVRWVT